jgi:hypothetical protein
MMAGEAILGKPGDQPRVRHLSAGETAGTIRDKQDGFDRRDAGKPGDDRGVAPRAGAKIRLADEYEAAQKAGEVAKNSDSLRRGSVIPDENNGKPSAADIGISVHDGRMLREADVATSSRVPG